MKRKRAKIGKSRVIKLSLNSVLKDEYRENFVTVVENWCHTATIISVLASLLFLYKNNKAFDDNDENFFRGNGYATIKYCFNAVLKPKINQLPIEFRHLINQVVPNFAWPEQQGLGNAFNKLIDQYTTNVKNNIKKWSYSRIKTFFAVKRYELNLFGHNISDIDVKNATKSVMFNNIVATENVNLLLQHAELIGIPVGRRLEDIVRNNWFQTIPIFINIQRQIFQHHENVQLLNDRWQAYNRDPANITKPNIARPPKIRNFRAIPIHDFHMKHIRIDIHLFYEVACKLGALKLTKGVFGKPVNISKEEYDRNPHLYWDPIFKMDKIDRIAKNRMVFDYAIVTDSVDVSLCYQKPILPAAELTNEEIKFRYENNWFTFVLGMDPGVRTWNATVRKHIASGVEV